MSKRVVPIQRKKAEDKNIFTNSAIAHLSCPYSMLGIGGFPLLGKNSLRLEMQCIVYAVKYLRQGGLVK